MGLEFPSLEINDEDTIESILNIKEKEFDLFRLIFERVCELCGREIGDDKKVEYIQHIKQLTLKQINDFILSFSMLKINGVAPIKLKISMILYVWSLSTLQAAHKYCFYSNPFRTFIGLGNIYDLNHVLEALFSLEDVSASKQAGIVHKHFINKYLETEKKKKSEQARQAANVRHEQKKQKDIENLKQVKKIWISKNWATYTECANDIHRNQLIQEDNYRKIYDLVSKAAKSKN